MNGQQVDKRQQKKKNTVARRRISQGSQDEHPGSFLSESHFFVVPPLPPAEVFSASFFCDDRELGYGYVTQPSYLLFLSQSVGIPMFLSVRQPTCFSELKHTSPCVLGECLRSPCPWILLPRQLSSALSRDPSHVDFHLRNDF